MHMTSSDGHFKRGPVFTIEMNIAEHNDKLGRADLY